MHHSPPSAITYPSPPALRPIPALLHPALLHTSLPHHQHTTYSTQPYDTPHCPTTSTCPTPPYSTTCTCPTPPSPTTDLTALPPAPALLHPTLRPVPALLHPALLPTSLHHHLHTTYSSTRLSILDPPTLPMCTLLPIHYCALTCYTYYPAHRTHMPHSTPPISPTDVPCRPHIL